MIVRIDSRTLLDEAIFFVQTLLFHQYLIVIKFILFYKFFPLNLKVSYCSFLNQVILRKQFVGRPIIYLFIQPTETLVWRTFYNAALYCYNELSI